MKHWVALVACALFALGCPAKNPDNDGGPAFRGQDAQHPNNSRTYTCFNSAGVQTACSSLPTAAPNEGETTPPLT